MNAVQLAARVKDRALALGFDDVGITDLAPPPHVEELTRWLKSGMAGNMTYLNRQAARRRQPEKIVPGAARAVMLARSYYRSDPPPEPGEGDIAMYARGQDYHTSLAQPLEELARFIRDLGPPGTIAKAWVDSGPVPERELAQRAGLGWIGKNTMLVSPTRGSFFFLASVFTSLDLAVDLPFQADRCGSCRRCLDACPTGALTEPRVLDSRRCISYLTIEYRGEIPGELAARMGNRIFGCDDCQDVCPWNEKFAEPQAAEAELEPWRVAPDLRELAGMSDEAFKARYGNTPLARPGARGMRRNARIALANAAREEPCPIP